MPELPEVERAARVLDRAATGRVIGRVRLLHRSLERRIAPAQLRALAGARVARVERRGKHQLLHLDDGRTVHVHFRMTGDWFVDESGSALPLHARAAIEFTDGTRIVLHDPRALATIDIHPAGAPLALGLGPEPDDEGFTPEWLLAQFAKRRAAIKPVLLDQRVIAGLGNIYAAEALWRARIDPRAPAPALARPDVVTLIAAMRAVIRRATGARYRDARAARLDVYDREGKPCRRCRTPIVRIVQAGRSTYCCPGCQIAGAGEKRSRRQRRR